MITDFGILKDGMSNLAGILRLMQDLDVKVHLGAETVSIEKSGKQVTGITLASGETFAADYVVSNMEVILPEKLLEGLRRW